MLGYADKVREFIAGGVDPNKTNERGENLLHAAADGSYPDIAACLIDEHGMDVNAPTEDGYTPLHCAAEEGRASVATLLIERGAEVDAETDSRWTPLYRAVLSREPETVRVLLEKGASISVGGGRLLSAAAFEGDIQTVRLLLAHGADVNADTPLLSAAVGGHVEIARLLLENGADIAAWDEHGMPFDRALRAGHAEVVRILWPEYQRRRDEMNEQRPSLHTAAATGHVAVVQVLLELGADPTETDGQGQTPLDMAERWGNPEAAEVLREAMGGL